MAGPCCDTSMRLNDLCVLQYSKDGGDTWLDVTDWVTNFGNCVRGNVPDPVPPDPGDGKTNQHACNIAGFLSERVIREALSKLSDNLIAGGNQLAWVNSLDFGLASKFPMTTAALFAFETFYNAVSVQVLAQITAAAADSTLWSDITCAIYNAIKTDGYVTDGNFAACAAAIHAVSYADFWVTNSIGNFWTAVGIGTIRNWQNVGALDDIDCTGCGESCHDLAFQGTSGGWVTYGTTIATWSAGIGWTAAYNAGANVSRVAIYHDLGGVYNVSGYEFDIVHPGGSPSVYCDLEMSNGGSVTGTFHVDPPDSPAIQTVGLHNQTPLAADRIYIDFAVFGNWTPNMRIIDVRIYFEGPNPFGADNCP